MKFWWVALFCLGLVPTAARAGMLADLPPLAIGPTVGTGGIGLQASVPILPGRLDLNTGFGGFGLTHDVTADGTRFHGKLNIGGVPLTLSWFPFANFFHVDAGIDINDNRVSVSAVAPADTDFTIYGHHYGAADIGTLTGRTHFHKVAPYIGFGFGDPFRGGRLTVILNAGVMFEGSPNIRLTASNPAILQVPGAAADIRAEEASLNSKANFVRFYPVLNLGVVYRF